MDIHSILAMAVEKKASDIHIMPLCKPLLRVDGTLTPIKDSSPLTAEDTQQLLYSLLTPEQQETFEDKLVLEVGLSFPDLGNFRASLFHEQHGKALVIRIIPSKVPTIDELELPAVIKTLLTLPYGLILVSGPTGCGKSTTLAALIDYINTYRVCKIITIEDPVEYIHENKRSVINQLQVGRDTVAFSNALRSSLRQDPNVIMLGELRDLETMRLALTAAETGHLVLATIHAGSAPLSINRFADVFPVLERSYVRTLLSETVQAVISQRLVKRINGGRVAAFEIMLASPAIRHYIHQDMPASMESTMQTSGDVGMITFDSYLNELVKKRQITSLVASSVLNEIKAFSDKREQRKK